MTNQLKIILGIIGAFLLIILVLYIAIDNGNDTSLDAKPVELLITTGNNHMDKQNYNKAIKYYKAALKKDKDDKDISFNDVRVDLAICYINIKDYPNAKTLLDHVIEIQPRHSKAHYNLGVWYVENNQNKSAVDEFSKYLEIEPHGVLADTCKKLIAELNK